MSERIVVCLTSAEQEYQAFQAEDARAPGQSLAASVEVLVAEDNAVLQIQQLVPVHPRRQLDPMVS